jgi:hypothetical protein
MYWKIISLMLALPLLSANAAGFSIDSAAATFPNGSAYSVPVMGDFAVGEGVRSFELELDFPNYWNITGYDLTGSMLASWGANFSGLADNDGFTAAAALDTDMEGTGVLFYIDVEVQGSGYMRIMDSMINEGLIIPTTTNGYFTHTLPATLPVYSTVSGAMLVSESRQFYVSSGDTPPLNWSMSNPALGPIGTDGIFQATGQGLNSALVVDDLGLVGESAAFTIYSLKMGVTPVTVTAGDSFMLPIYIENPAAFEFSSFEFDINLHSRLQLNAISTVGTLSAGWSSIVLQQDGNNVYISAAASSDDSVSGEGVLIYLDISSSIGGGANTTASLANVYIDEDYLVLKENGTIYLNASNSFYLYPNSALLKRTQTQQFSVNGTPNGTLSWSSLDPAVGTVNSSGLFTALSGGTTSIYAEDPLGVNDMTGIIEVYDLDVWVHSMNAPADNVVRVPIKTDALSGFSVNSWEFEFSYSNTWLTFIGLDQTGSLSTTWTEIYFVETGTTVVAAGAGADLPGVGDNVVYLEFAVDLHAPENTSTNITLHSFMFNEGDPYIKHANGTLTFVPAPLLLNISISGSDAILNWNDAPGALYYHVFRSLTGYGPWTEIATPALSIYTDTGSVTTPGEFYYQVSAEMP